MLKGWLTPDGSVAGDSRARYPAGPGPFPSRQQPRGIPVDDPRDRVSTRLEFHKPVKHNGLWMIFQCIHMPTDPSSMKMKRLFSSHHHRKKRPPALHHRLTRSDPAKADKRVNPRRAHKLWTMATITLSARADIGGRKPSSAGREGGSAAVFRTQGRAARRGRRPGAAASRPRIARSHPRSPAGLILPA